MFRSKTGTTVHAVNGIRFSAFSGQIMALLGHNGAGKTTTMSILTGQHRSATPDCLNISSSNPCFLFTIIGLYSATGGTAIINGYDINTNIEKIRGSLGLCPQHNMLFPSLTVVEHLRFFGMVGH